jgi:hypothetical protein
LSATGAIPVRERKELGCGLSWWLGRVGARRPASIFFVLIPFLFSVFPIFLHIIYKNASNQFKPLLEIL